jgi:hypothetical protein
MGQSGIIVRLILKLGSRWRCVVRLKPRPLYLRGIKIGTNWLIGYVDLEGALNPLKKGICPCFFYCAERCLVTALTAFDLLIEMSTQHSKNLLLRKLSKGISWIDLTLILLTWTIWWAPSNAIKWQMGFNSSFKDGWKRTRYIFW